MPTTNDWLDRIVAEQAAYYGLTVEEFIKFSATLCELQEFADEWNL